MVVGDVLVVLFGVVGVFGLLLFFVVDCVFEVCGVGKFFFGVVVFDGV